MVAIVAMVVVRESNLPRGLGNSVDRKRSATVGVGGCCVFVTQGIDTLVDASREAIDSRGGSRLGYPLTAACSLRA